MMAATNDKLRGVLKRNEPMARHTSWRTGGPARCFYQPADLEDLALFITGLSADDDIIWLGLGSNLLVRDGGIDGSVIATFGGLNKVEWLNKTSMRVEAGVASAKVARISASQGLVGGEFFAGIPGTMGGALAMNASAFGGETWERVTAVETLDRQGKTRVRTPDSYQVGYRSVQGPLNEWFVAAHLRFEEGDVEVAQSRIKSLLERRGECQPTNQASCGSVFRNPPGDHAARLIDACGLKGTCIGAACVSDKHANFIINTGGASAADIEVLIEQVRAEVERQKCVRLETEVHVVGVPLCEVEI